MDVGSWEMVLQELGDMYTGGEIQKAYRVSWKANAPHGPRVGEAEDRLGRRWILCCDLMWRTLSCLGSTVRSLVMDLSGHQCWWSLIRSMT